MDRSRQLRRVHCWDLGKLVWHWRMAPFAAVTLAEADWHAEEPQCSMMMRHGISTTLNSHVHAQVGCLQSITVPRDLLR